MTRDEALAEARRCIEVLPEHFSAAKMARALLEMHGELEKYIAGVGMAWMQSAADQEFRRVSAERDAMKTTLEAMQKGMRAAAAIGCNRVHTGDLLKVIDKALRSPS